MSKVVSRYRSVTRVISITPLRAKAEGTQNLRVGYSQFLSSLKSPQSSS